MRAVERKIPPEKLSLLTELDSRVMVQLVKAMSAMLGHLGPLEISFCGCTTGVSSECSQVLISALPASHFARVRLKIVRSKAIETQSFCDDDILFLAHGLFS